MNKNLGIRDILVRFDEISKHYVRELDNYSLAELCRKPSKSEWSLGQMYLHLPHSTLNLQLRLAEQCMARSVAAARRAERRRRPAMPCLSKGVSHRFAFIYRPTCNIRLLSQRARSSLSPSWRKQGAACMRLGRRCRT